MIVRPATPDDAPACAGIVSAWIEATDWMPGGPSRDDLEAMMRKGFPIREAWVAETEDGEIAGYLSMRPHEDHIIGLYTSEPGSGAGKALLDHAKGKRDYLQLNSHLPNRAAHRFYEREGFVMVEQDLEGTDGVPEVRMEWRR
ncbi:GNAT family N-acetyltransferase [Jannaschia aquimarina]|uniref:Putative acetyltransferase n=1 Tax=Jannaschia aquimarina TaxID=935700 RepID=A0A0D1DAI5_9RHOB|nr:GNAT family N-acetyltransferase [Jannaschia aquimarina]KIT16943.1 putative acetyltransferase [Jannaschia aquimarina]SNT11077.1 putative acetyltransferase [Jannaschia aquimarina]